MTEYCTELRDLIQGDKRRETEKYNRKKKQ